MKTMRQWATLLLNIVIVVLIIWFWLDRKDQDNVSREYWENPNFKTDSIKVDVDYTKLPTPTYKNYVPPKVVVNYTPPNPPGVSISFNDSLIQVIDSLKRKIYTISALYLKLYPTAPKLIYGEFTRDSLRFDLLFTDGQIYSSTFGVNYNRFSYQWKEGGFRATEISQKNKTKLQSLAHAYAGYDVTHTLPIIGLDYSLTKSKLRFKANTFLTIEQKPEWFLQGSVGYRIYGN